MVPEDGAIMVKGIIARVFPYDRVHDTYQEYYRNALSAGLAARGGHLHQISGAFSVTLLRKLRTVRHSYRLRRLMSGKRAPRLLDALAGMLSRGPLMDTIPRVGKYTFTTEKRGAIRVCIDSNDYPEISTKHAPECDIYFKSNYWPSYDYPSHVLPLPNMNPLVGRNLEFLKSLRSAPRQYDLFAFFRVWGGSDEVSGIEHNMALLEGLSKVKCNSFILAFLVAGDIAALGKRLDDIGVRWTTEALPPLELWKRMAAARLNIVRMGMHQCVPWRMIDVLAMGGVPVLDHKPITVWPAPLEEERHYLNLDISPDRGHESGYISERVESWLKSDSLISSVSHNAAGYFDRFLEPEMLGRSIIQAVESWPSAMPGNL